MKIFWLPYGPAASKAVRKMWRSDLGPSEYELVSDIEFERIEKLFNRFGIQVVEFKEK